MFLKAGTRSCLVSIWMMSPIELWQVQSLCRQIMFQTMARNIVQVLLETGNWKLWEIPFMFGFGYGFGRVGSSLQPLQLPRHLLGSKPKASLMRIKDLNFWRSYDSPDCHSTNEEKKRWPRSSMKTRDAKAPSQRTMSILCSPGRSLPFFTWEMFSNSWLTLGLLYHPWLDKARVQLAKWLFPE